MLLSFFQNNKYIFFYKGLNWPCSNCGNLLYNKTLSLFISSEILCAVKIEKFHL